MLGRLTESLKLNFTLEPAMHAEKGHGQQSAKSAQPGSLVPACLAAAKEVSRSKHLSMN
jgi:hypothetical protein